MLLCLSADSGSLSLLVWTHISNSPGSLQLFSAAYLVPFILRLSASWAKLLLRYMNFPTADDQYCVLPLPITRVSFIIIYKYVHIDIHSIGSVPLEKAD